MERPENSHVDDPLAEGPEPVPRGARAMAVLRWALLVASIALAVFSWWSYARAERGGGAGHAVHLRYHCPMHPQIVADQPGECPICHMSLEPMAEDHAGDAGAPDAAVKLPSGTAPVTLSLDRIQAIGVRTAVVVDAPAASGVRATAVIAATEQGVAEVHVRTAGFVERIDAAQTGVRVARGQTLLALYAPELYQAQSELLAARQWGGADAGARATDGARRKLELLGMSASEIDRVAVTGEPIRAVSIAAPAGGVVTKKGIVLGSYVTPETALYEIQDLSRVYVTADVSSSDAAAVRVGVAGRFVLSRDPSLSVEAKIDLVYPAIIADARTTRVRMQTPNDLGAFRPGDFGVVTFDVPAPPALIVPRDAVVDTGESTYVFVDDGGGRFTPRAVLLGGERGESVVVREGLARGERVVSGATFLLDSESRVRASIAAQAAP